MIIENNNSQIIITFDEILSICSVEKDLQEIKDFFLIKSDINEFQINLKNIKKIDTSYYQFLISLIFTLNNKKIKGEINKSEIFRNIENLF